MVVAAASFGLGLQLLEHLYDQNGPNTVELSLFYSGLILIFVPCAWRLFDRTTGRQERIQVCVTLGIALLLSYYLRSPLRFDRFDELLHLGTLHQMMLQHRMFTENLELPISPFYPGLELVTAAAHWITGLPLVASQILVLGASRLLLVLGIFLILERISSSSYMAGIGVLIYSTSTQFYAFNAGFAYQTLSLPLALGVVYLTLRSLDSTHSKFGRHFGLAVACLGALTVTHHVVSWITVAFLMVWNLALLWRGRRSIPRPNRIKRADVEIVSTTAVIGLLMVTVWSAFVGYRLWTYLAPSFGTAYDQISGYVGGTSGGRKLFQDSAGVGTPGWQCAVIVGSVLGWLLLIGVAGWALVRGRILRNKPLRWLLLLVTLTYPLLLAVRVFSTRW